MAKLFHYERFEPKFFEPNLERSTIFLSVPGEFNDPWDCRPSFNTTALDDPGFYERQVQFFDQSSRRHTPDALTEPERLRRLSLMRSNRAVLQSLIDQSSADIEGAIDERYRVYCLSTKPTHVLMWSHYALRHKGLCLEFATDNDVFCSAYRVDYSEPYPFFDLADEDEPTILKPFITKSDVWRYEEEFRLIAQERSKAVGTETLMTDAGLLKVPREALKSVIMGCLMPASDRELLRNLMQKYRPDVQIFIAVRTPNRFRLGIERVS